MKIKRSKIIAGIAIVASLVAAFLLGAYFHWKVEQRTDTGQANFVFAQTDFFKDLENRRIRIYRLSDASDIVDTFGDFEVVVYSLTNMCTSVCVYKFIHQNGVMSNDCRKLSPEQQEEIRRRAVMMVQDGTPPTEVARSLRLAPRSVFHWLARYRSGGWAGLKTGSRSGRPSSLDAEDMRWIFNKVADADPRLRSLTEGARLEAGP
jgi:hypothetical protein